MRDLRDILGEVIILESLGHHAPRWSTKIDEAKENDCKRADRIIRMLEARGVELRRAGSDITEPPPPEAMEIWRYPLVGGKAARAIRKTKKADWSLILITDGKETVEQSFTVEEANLNGGLVLTGDARAAKIDGLGRQLAALNEIYRVGAADLGVGHAI